MSCSHPSEQRWQWRHFWQCCLCGLKFWGSSSEAQLRPLLLGREPETWKPT
jgi:hypothetical protein